MSATSDQPLSRGALVVGSMVGAGIFTLPAAFARTTGVLGTLIAWCIAGAGMLYAGGAKFVLLSALLYAPGTWLYFYARREQRQRVFSAVEMVIFGGVASAAIVALVALASGAIVV